MLPCLSTTAVAKAAGLQDEGAQDAKESRQYKDQYTWIQEVDGQEPTYTEGANGFDEGSQVYRRPEHPSPIPKLQGPFQLTSDENDGNTKDEDLEFSDIQVIASKIDSESLDAGNDSDSEPDMDEYGLSAALVCLMTRSGRVYVCLDLEGVEGQWLPRKKPTHQTTYPADPYLVLLEGLDTLDPNEADESEWPTFSPDIDSRYSFFTTHSQSVFFFALDPWIPNLEKELQSADSTGISFRLDVFRNGPGTLRERILFFNQDSFPDQSTVNTVPACLALEDSDLGYFLLTTHNNNPQAATLDRPYPTLAYDVDPDENDNNLPDMNALAIGPPRSAYQPANAFYAPSELPSFVDHKVPARHKHLLSQQIRLSPATLDLMTEAHRVLSRETHQLGIAAADLFRRCERLIEELKDQIGRVQECAVRTDNIVGDDGDGDEGQKGKRTKRAKLSLEERVQSAREKQATLQERHEALKKKLHGAGGRKLSEKEKAWGLEVERTGDTITESRSEGLVQKRNAEEDEDEEDEENEDEGEHESGIDKEERHENGQDPNVESKAGALQKRLQEVHQLKASLLAHTSDIAAAADETLPQNRPQDDSLLVIPRDLKARKMAQVMALLEREYVSLSTLALSFLFLCIALFFPFLFFLFFLSFTRWAGADVCACDTERPWWMRRASDWTG